MRLGTGIAGAALLTAFLALILTGTFALMPVLREGRHIEVIPSAALLRALGEAGIGLLIAYTVAISGAEQVLRNKTKGESHEAWLGFAAGIGLCGFLGIGVALGLAEHRDAGHANFLDEAGFWWVVSSVGFLGLLVALLPILNYEWRK